MTITIFGFIWSIINIFALSQNIKYMISILLFSCVFQSSAVILIGDVAIAPWVFTSAFLILKSFISKRDKKRSKEEKIAVLFFVSAMLITSIALIIFHAMPVPSLFVKNIDWTAVTAVYEPLKLKTLHITNTIIFALFILDFIYISRIKEQINYSFIEQTFKSIIIFVIIIGFIQYICTNFDLSTNLLERLIYSDTSNETISIYRLGNAKRLYSTFTEPSYCGTFMSAAFWYLIIKDKNKMSILSILLLVEIILARSSTGYAAFLVGTIIYFLLYGNLKMFFKLMLLALVGCFILVKSGYLDIIYNMVITKEDSISGIERSAWNVEAIKIFFKTYFWGVGFSSIRASSFLFNILAQIGIIGTSIFGAFIYSLCKGGFRKNSSPEQKANTMFLLTVLAGQVIACPDLTFTVLWLAIFINLLGIKLLEDKQDTTFCIMKKTSYKE